MAGSQDKRLERLETACPERPPIATVSARFGKEAEAYQAYYDATPEDQQAEVLVAVLKFCEADAAK